MENTNDFNYKMPIRTKHFQIVDKSYFLCVGRIIYILCMQEIPYRFYSQIGLSIYSRSAINVMNLPC